MISRGPSVTHLAGFVNGSAFKPSDLGEQGTPVVRIRQLLDEGADVDLAEPPASPVWLNDGDLVFSWSATLAVRFWNRGRALLNQHLYRVDVHPGIDRTWFAYVLEEGVQRLTPLMHGSAMTHITQDMLRWVTIALPPFNEQRAIADYLDRETARIDALIAAKQRMKVLITERRDAELRLFTDPGSVRSVPIRRIVQKQERRPRSSAVVTAFRDGRVMARSRRRLEGFTESEAQTGYQGVEEGDIVFHGLDGFAGAIGVSEDPGACSPVYHVCAAREGFDAHYVALSLRALALSGYLALQSGNVRERAVDFRNWETLARVPIPVPSSETQRSRARAFVKRRDWTERLTARIDQQVALLNERRQTLITAAVTGDLRVAVPA